MGVDECPCVIESIGFEYKTEPLTVNFRLRLLQSNSVTGNMAFSTIASTGYPYTAFEYILMFVF